MRKSITLVFLALLLLCGRAQSQVTCSTSGNLWVYANYDGGILNISVDVNMPNIKIGVCTYEPTTINISGPYAGNVTEVRYAGYVSTNNFHCNNSPSTTTITGVPSNITSVNFLPPATLSNPNGYSSIVCAYSCSTTSNQGGCNTADQIKDYFQQSMGATLTSYHTQYGCWGNTFLLSAGGNCCSTVLPCNIVANAGADQQMCAGLSATLQGSATGGATTYSWSPTTGLSNPNAAMTTASPTVTTTYVLTATDGGICADQDTVVVHVNQATPPAWGPLSAVCVNTAPYLLTGGTPTGGYYSGTAVTNGVFNPAAAGPGLTTIGYTVTDGFGCTATTLANIHVQPLPVVTMGQLGPYCLNGTAVPLTAGSPSGGVYSGPSVANGIFTPSAAGLGNHTITYDYTDSVGCTGSATGTATVNANPQAPAITFSAPTLSSTPAGDSVQWFLNGNYVAGNAGSWNPTQSGNYTAVVWVNGCPSAPSAALEVTIVGLADDLWGQGLQVWPNPATTVLMVALPGQAFAVRVLDVTGREVLRRQPMAERGAVALAGLATGVYMLEVQSETGRSVVRFVKE